MKKLMLIGVVVAGLVAAIAIPAFAHGPDSGDDTSVNRDAWQTMYKACLTGDWDAMAEAAEDVHKEDFVYMPCYGGGYYAPGNETQASNEGTQIPDEGTQAPGNRWDEMGDYMGGGMMGGGMMGGSYYTPNKGTQAPATSWDRMGGGMMGWR